MLTIDKIPDHFTLSVEGGELLVPAESHVRIRSCPFVLHDLSIFNKIIFFHNLWAVSLANGGEQPCLGVRAPTTI